MTRSISIVTALVVAFLAQGFASSIQAAERPNILWITSEEDGLSQNTIVFYYSDHGGSMPRGKSYIYDSGTHVPLIIRVPERWQSIKLAWTVTTWK